MIKQHYSPLRYPGGKVSLYDFLKKMLKQNGIIDGVYAEGFAGGAGAALKLLMLEEVNEIYLNDKDKFIYKFWDSVLNHTDELLALINDTKVNLDEWNYRKKILKSEEIQKDLSDVQIAFTTFFLNRSNRSGILKAGVIGGKEQEGEWKIDARYNKADLMKRIEKIFYYKERIHLSNKDVIDFFNDLKKKKFKENEILYYLDPPYVQQGKELYLEYFNHSDHIRLSKYLQKNLKNVWLTSYDDHSLIHSIYKEVTKNIFEFNYYANKTKIGKELIIASKNCKMVNEYSHYSRKKIITDNIEINELILNIKKA
ncbi:MULTISPECIES: DNA adenine methylase [Flavobacterium]|uniref:site-specific DNA-methyltransferase (adenine-specific) n=1 Tax=Flavobacterium keumense TaxID=1306518 RepID=A0ABY8N960_9FLAO|nr:MULTISPECIES: DNA adenine methylase [Flavobacterium]WGK95126.1 DNA adenine methylase [Flavobacterium keumense]